MANAKCLKCTTFFELKIAKTSTAKLQCPKCGNKALVYEYYDEYERYSKQKAHDELAKKEEELKKRELELKKKEEALKIEKAKSQSALKQIKYREGIYTGESLVINGKRVREGKGTYKSNDGDVYSGTWKADFLTGECEQRFKDGTYNAGTFEKGKLICGKTKRNFANGVYEGDIDKGLFDGKGKITLTTGQEYIGEFKAGKRSGKGVCKYPNGEKYDGMWLNDMREGKGTYYYAGVQREEAT